MPCRVERAASRWIVSSDPEEHVESIRPYVELGFRHLVFHAPGPGPGALPEAVWRAGAAAAAPPLRMNMTPRLELFAVPGLPMVQAGRRSALR